MIKKLLFFILLLLTFQLATAQAPGDNCASATPLTLVPGATISTGLQTTGATNEIGFVPTCLVPAAPISPTYAGATDGVYVIDVTNPGDHTFAFPAVGATTFKTLAVYPACPIVAGDCVAGFYTTGLRNGSITANLAVGTYYIVIDGALFGGTVKDFNLQITAPPIAPPNDLCSGAIELFSNVNCLGQTFTNLVATDSGELPVPGCAGYAGGDVWFTYEVNSTGEFTVETLPGVITDGGLAVYSGSCGALSLEACNDDAGVGLMSLLNITTFSPGDIAYIRVWELGNNNNGTFDICITTPVPAGTNGVVMDCPGEFPRELTSDIGITCGTVAGTTSLGSSYSGTLTAGTDPVAPRPNGGVNSAVCDFSGLTSNYTTIPFTVDTTGEYIFEMTSAGFDGMGYIVEAGFTPGVCGPGFIVRDDDSGFGLLPQLTAILSAGTNYVLITTVFSFSSTTVSGPFTWDISFPVSTPQPDWFTSAVGGTAIGSGDGFNPVGVAGSGLPDTNTPGIYSFWAECPTNPGVREQADYIIGMVWDGSESSDWTDPLNWNRNFVPGPSECVFIPAGTPNDPVVNDDLNADGFSLTIETGASVNLTSDGNANNITSSLTIQDEVNVQAGGSLIIPDGASLIQVNDSAVNTGNITLSRIAQIRQSDYVYWSSPVANFDVSNVYGGFTPTAAIYEWIPTTATGFLGMPGNVPIVVGDWSALSSGTMDQGKGYAVKGPTNQPATPAPATAVFNGVPNNGLIRQPLSSGGYSGGSLIYNPYGFDNLVVLQTDDNWNLLGNPYPSALDADAFLLANTMLEGAVHIWTHGTEIGNNGESFYDDFVFSYDPADYITYNLMGSTTPFSGQIASGQGFFVLALNNNESGNATFNNSMRSAANTDFYRTANSNNNVSDVTGIERHRIWLTLGDQNGRASDILVGYIEGATQEKDRLFDAFTRELNTLSLYSKIGDERMSIQGRALPFNENDQVPLGTVIPQAGQYTIAISKVDGLFLDDNQDIYLEDTYTGTIHNLKAAPYTFTESEATDYKDRFLLRYTADALSINDFELNAVRIIAPKGEYIKINSDDSPIDSVIVYDLLGRALINTSYADTSEVIINNTNLSSGTYMVNVTLRNGSSKTQKVILKQ
jgi:hypothetical protein